LLDQRKQAKLQWLQDPSEINRANLNSVRHEEPLVPDPSHLEVEIAIAKMKKYKSPGSDQIPADLLQAGGEALVSVIHRLITYIWNKEELPDQWKESVILPVHKKGDKTVIIILGYHCYQLHTTFYGISFFHN
jgi:hypothetical protein